ncbi:MAG: DUF1177 domain-containing protein [Sporolactobacillus sp.]|jgi:hypothetical protein|nr:DUF1177 domain-containing protein [Sporolactobacillus sp.]
MLLNHTLSVIDTLDDVHANGQTIVDLFKGFDSVIVTSHTVQGEKGSTDFVKIIIKGQAGKSSGGKIPTLGIIGRLGGIGARPARIGLVSDGDGAVAAIAAALKLASMQLTGDKLKGDVIVATHVCPTAPTLKHQPVDFMDSPIDIRTMNQYEVAPEMDAVVSIDTTKGNRIVNYNGIAISPTVKEGYILRISEDLLRIQEMVTGRSPVTLPITSQDITPYGNNIYHLNSILQPAVATDAPVIGVAITTESIVPGCGTGASHEVDVSLAATFAVEVAKEISKGSCSFYDEKEFDRIKKLYGSMKILQTKGRTVGADR